MVPVSGTDKTASEMDRWGLRGRWLLRGWRHSIWQSYPLTGSWSRGLLPIHSLRHLQRCFLHVNISTIVGCWCQTIHQWEQEHVGCAVEEPGSEGILRNTLEVCNKTHLTKYLWIYILTWVKFAENVAHTSWYHNMLWMYRACGGGCGSCSMTTNGPQLFQCGANLGWRVELKCRRWGRSRAWAWHNVRCALMARWCSRRHVTFASMRTSCTGPLDSQLRCPSVQTSSLELISCVMYGQLLGVSRLDGQIYTSCDVSRLTGRLYFVFEWVSYVIFLWIVWVHKEILRVSCEMSGCWNYFFYRYDSRFGVSHISCRFCRGTDKGTISIGTLVA
jgi:hypothetical protein